MRNFALVLSLFLLISCGKEETRPVNEGTPPLGPTQPETLPIPKEPISAPPTSLPEPVVTPTPNTPNIFAPLKGYGIQFIGTTQKLNQVKEEMALLLEEIGLKNSSLISLQININKNTLEYTLVSDSTDSMNLIHDRNLSIKNKSETIVNQRGR